MRVNCVRNNCDGPYHRYWAIDFIDTNYSTFDPIYVAGAGILHIGAVMGPDQWAAPGGKVVFGTWGWIDHGGSRTTTYTHLYQLLAGRDSWSPRQRCVAEHNSAGYSAWSASVKVTPGRTTPLAPRAPRALSTTRTSIRYAWSLPVKNGTAPITRFQVARRCLVRGSWIRWAYTRLPAHVKGSWNLHHNWEPDAPPAYLPGHGSGGKLGGKRGLVDTQPGHDPAVTTR